MWNVSRYYTPVAGQQRYYNGSFERDLRINCSGDCLVTADGYRLTEADAYKVAACPPEIPLGTVLHIAEIGYVTCHDHGGAIKGHRLDVWAGIGDAALDRMSRLPSGLLLVHRKTYEAMQSALAPRDPSPVIRRCIEPPHVVVSMR